MRDLNDMMIISKYESLQECRKWCGRLPAFNFDKKWDVQIIPPFGGAIIRFCIKYNDKQVSVYFDGYSELGYMVDENDEPVPYFEYYDGTDCHRYYMHESEKMMDDIRGFLNSKRTGRRLDEISTG